MKDLLQLKQDFTEQGVLIGFNGAFHHSLIEELGNAAKSYLELRHTTPNTITDVFALYIEQTQNVRNYVVARNLSGHERETAIVVIGFTGTEYTVSSGNFILQSDVEPLRERLQSMDGLDKPALKQLYKEQLHREIPPGARGAGLGLIDMARRATEPLEFAFFPQDSRFDFFTLTARVAGGA